MSNFYERKRIVITGCAGGIGRAVAAVFLDNDAEATLVDVSADALATAADALGSSGLPGFYVKRILFRSEQPSTTFGVGRIKACLWSV